MSHTKKFNTKSILLTGLHVNGFDKYGTTALTMVPMNKERSQSMRDTTVVVLEVAGADINARDTHTGRTVCCVLHDMVIETFMQCTLHPHNTQPGIGTCCTAGGCGAHQQAPCRTRRRHHRRR